MFSVKIHLPDTRLLAIHLKQILPPDPTLRSKVVRAMIAHQKALQKKAWLEFYLTLIWTSAFHFLMLTALALYEKSI